VSWSRGTAVAPRVAESVTCLPLRQSTPRLLKLFFDLRSLPGNRTEAADVSLFETSIVDGSCCEDGLDMSVLLPISFLVTLLCGLGAMEGFAFQQFLFVGMAAGATILACSLEAWSCRELPVRADEEGGQRSDR
jgi:hypothetical protein